MREVISSTMMVDRDHGSVEINIEGWVEYHIERDYGADADGNRGVKRVFVDDIDDIMAYDSSGENIELTDSEKEAAVEILVRRFLEG